MQDNSLNSHTVEKIGGTSMSNVDAVFKNILLGNREKADIYNRVFVVSAYGGMTDRLLEHKKSQKPGVYALYSNSESDWAWGDALSDVAREMRKINDEIFHEAADRQMANQFIEDRIEGTRSCLVDLHRLCSYGHFQLEEHLATVREMLSALGEVHSAYNTALLLNRRGVNATFVDLSGWRSLDSYTLEKRINEAFDEIDLSRQLPIVTGYAQTSDGLMKHYGRGYSEVTFSQVACLTQAREAIIHKEFHLSSADPRLVGPENVHVIGETNYDVADQLSNMGMEAIHPLAAKGLRELGIPLRIKNTFEPEHPGTIIRDNFYPSKPRAEIVTGLEHVYEVEIFNQHMVGTFGNQEKVLETFRRFNVRTVTKSMNANTITHYVAAPIKQVRRCVETLEKILPDDVEINTQKVALVSVIGANLGCQTYFPRAVSALHENGIATLFCHTGSRNVDMQFVTHEGEFAQAVKVLHDTVMEAPEKLDSAAA
ncbi:aspartate kinase [Terasakiella sp.]|uniref:aspartate kinase n=1 Tax=Terasakiella sp. TaxID=2034861 RepID=UPI003AA7F93B